jgi:hypothetical protein
MAKVPEVAVPAERAYYKVEHRVQSTVLFAVIFFERIHLGNHPAAYLQRLLKVLRVSRNVRLPLSFAAGPSTTSDAFRPKFSSTL